MTGAWKRRGVAASFVVFLLAGWGCGPKGTTVRPDMAAGARPRLTEILAEEPLPLPEAESLDEPVLPAVRETETYESADVMPAFEPEEQVAAPAEEEEVGVGTPADEEAEEPVAEDEGGVEEEPTDDDWGLDALDE